MKSYPNYKYTNIDWIGEIPEHWKALKIKRLTQVKRGASPRPIDDPKFFDEDNGEFGWVRIADVTASERYLEFTTQKMSELGASLSVKQYPGDFFLSIAGTVGKPVITRIKCCIHDGFVWFPNLKVNHEFLYYLFHTGLPYQGLGKFGTQLNLNSDTVGDINIPLPSIKEIEAIIIYLDQKTALIDELIAKKERKIELLKENRTALINHAVTKGLDPTLKYKNSGIEWIGEIPEHWRVTNIKSISDLLRGRFSHRPRNDERFYTGDYPFIQTGDIVSAGKYLNTFTQTLNELGYSVSKEFPIGTIVMAIAGNIGDVAILAIKSCFPDSIIGFYPKENSNGEFLYYLFTSLKYEFIKNSTVSTQLNLNVERVGSIKVPLAPIEEQQQIVTYLDTQTSIIDQNVTLELQKIEKLKEYRQSLISNVVTGKICVLED